MASAPLSVKEYLAHRKKHAAASIKAARADSSAFVGKVVEIRGRVAGFSKSETGETGQSMIVCTPEDGSYVIEVDSLPEGSMNSELACLVTVGERSTHSLSDLRLLCCTYAVDLARVEEAAKPAKQAPAKPAPAKAKPAETTAQQAKAGQLTADEYVRAYRNAIKRFNRKLSGSQADTIARSILGFSLKYGVDARLVCAVIIAESNFRTDATSGCGAMGLGQLMPSTAAGLGVSNAYDPIDNIYGSVRYIKGMLDRMSGAKHWNELTWRDLALALAAYNAGPGAVRKHGGIPPYRETQNYVRKVTSIYKRLCGVGG